MTKVRRFIVANEYVWDTWTDLGILTGTRRAAAICAALNTEAALAKYEKVMSRRHGKGK